MYRLTLIVVFSLFAFFVTLFYYPVTSYSQEFEIVTITTADGKKLGGAFSSKENKGKIGVLVIHGRWSNFHKSIVARTLSEKLKNQYTILNMNTRSANYSGEEVFHDYTFEDHLFDIKAGIEFLQANGAANIFLVGHSFGSRIIGYYQRQTHDPRVKGLVMIGVGGNEFYLFRVVKHGDKFLSVLKLAEGNCRQGMPDKIIKVAILYKPDPSKKPPIRTFTSRAFYSLFRDNGNPDSTIQVPHIRVPVRIVIGTKDKKMNRNWMKKVYGKDTTIVELFKEKLSPQDKVEFDVVEGAGHKFKKYQDRLSDSVNVFISEVAK